MFNNTLVKPALQIPPHHKLIDLRSFSSHPILQPILKLSAAPIEFLLGIKDLNKMYARIVTDSVDSGRDVFESTLNVMQAEVSVTEQDLRKIPKHGPLTVVANHPFGGFEGVALAQMLARLRPDVKILGNFLLNQIHGIGDRIIAVDPFDNSSSIRRNAAALREALDWLTTGGALLVFPAGEVSHFHRAAGAVVDREWSPHIASLIQRSSCAVVPIYVEGHNSLLFQLAGMVHPRLRTALLPRELLNKRGSKLHIRIGNTIRSSEWQGRGARRQLSAYLQGRTYFLRQRQTAEAAAPCSSQAELLLEPLAQAQPSEMIDAEVAALPDSARLASQSDFDVFLLAPGQSAVLLEEIGRLREYTFRQVAEGCGRALDLDEFDETYYQLFLWNRARAEIAGAYRLGCCDTLLERGGLEALYTSSLFKFAPEFAEHLNHTVEVGRSFVRPEYQRHFASLALLWRGIGEFLVRNPRYRTLFGPVSISKSYHPLSRAIIVRYLRRHKLHARLAGLAQARTPFDGTVAESAEILALQDNIMNSTDVSHLISDIEADAKGMPILLQHYLKLNARVLQFNLDARFSDVLDALIWLDLETTEARFLKRYMGAQGFSTYSGFYGAASRPSAEGYCSLND